MRSERSRSTYWNALYMFEKRELRPASASATISSLVALALEVVHHPASFEATGAAAPAADGAPGLEGAAVSLPSLGFM